MRLAYLDPHAVPGECPEALQILYTVDALGSLGAQLALVTPRPPNTTPEAHTILGHALSANVELRHLEPCRGVWRWLRSNQPFYRRAIAVLKTLGVEAVLVRNLKMAEQLLRHAPEIPLFFETHELFAQSYREAHSPLSLRERRKLAALVRREAFVYRSARGLIVLTSLLLEDIRQAYGVETPAVVAPDGVDLEQARAPVSPAPQDKPCLLYLGSLHPWKGVETLIRALPHVLPPAELHIVGGNAPRIAELRRLAAELNVTARVVFHGPVEPQRRFEYIHRADICLLPLTDTGLGARYTSPLKLFEYMAAGKPIVASDLPSVRQVLTSEHNALLVPSGDAQAFAQAITRLLRDQGLRNRLGAAAKSRVQYFTWRARSDTIQRFIAVRIAHHAQP